jgi:hypothetical protein
MPSKRKSKKVKPDPVLESMMDDFNDEDLAGILDDDSPS